MPKINKIIILLCKALFILSILSPFVMSLIYIPIKLFLQNMMGASFFEEKKNILIIFTTAVSFISTSVMLMLVFRKILANFVTWLHISVGKIIIFIGLFYPIALLFSFVIISSVAKIINTFTANNLYGMGDIDALILVTAVGLGSLIGVGLLPVVQNNFKPTSSGSQDNGS